MYGSRFKVKSTPKSRLKNSVSIFGLMAGLAGWSQFASASGDGEGLQTVLIPEHYELLDDGSAVLRLHNGEPLTLNSDQFVVLNDGVLLIVDELAQAALTLSLIHI